MAKCNEDIFVSDFYKLLDEGMRGSYIGSIQLCTLHVSDDKMLDEKLF